jgi:hypothetical protein
MNIILKLWFAAVLAASLTAAQAAEQPRILNLRELSPHGIVLR